MKVSEKFFYSLFSTFWKHELNQMIECHSYHSPKLFKKFVCLKKDGNECFLWISFRLFIYLNSFLNKFFSHMIHMHAFYPSPNIFGKSSTTSWSKSSKTCNFENCPKLTSLKFQRWQFSNFHPNIFSFFLPKKSNSSALQLYKVKISKF
jgi:hypothetical protein